MNIIITGSSGFVGTNLSTYLKDRQFEIYNLSLRDSNWRHQIQRNADAIIHLAGKAHDVSMDVDSESYFKINRDLTITIFKEFLDSDIRDFIFFSSVKAVADTLEGVLFESEDPNPLTPYGKSKFEAEKYLLEHILPQNKRLIILRPTMIHGPGNKGNLNLLYKLVNKGIPWPLATFDNQRSFLGIDNLSFIIYELLIQPEVKSGVYNVADDEPLSTNKLVSLIGSGMNTMPRLWKISPRFIKAIAKVGDTINLPINSERLKKLTESYIVSNQKIKSALGIEKLPLTSEQSLQKTIISFNITK